jgi:Protein of unknown function (DUF1616)
MRRNPAVTSTGLAVTGTATVAAALVTGLIGSGGPGIAWLRVLAGVSLVLVLPGYALTAFARPARSPRRFSPVLWRWLWTAGLSLAVSVLGGLVLNLTPAGLTRVSWTILLTVVTLLAVAAAWLRTRSARPARQPRPAPRSALRSALRPVPRPAWMAAGYALAALAMAGTATGLAVVSGGWQHSPPFAQLWLVPGTSKATLGVRSAYPGARQFRLVLKNGTHPAGTWDFTLSSGQAWQRAVAAPAGQRLTAQLSTVGQVQTETVAIMGGEKA